MDSIAQVITRFLGEAGDQGDRRLDAVAIGAFNSPHSLSQVQLFVNYLLQSLRTRFNAKEDSGTSRPGH